MYWFLMICMKKLKNGTKINITGYIEYGINFMPTFVYMPAEIINRFGNQIINDILDYVIRKIQYYFHQIFIVISICNKRDINKIFQLIDLIKIINKNIK